MTPRYLRSKLTLIQRGDPGDLNFRPPNQPNMLLLLYLFFLVISAGFILLTLRLFQLTVVRGAYYSRLAEGNRIKEIIIEPRRGTIIDRKGITIVKSLTSNIKGNGERLSSLRFYESGEAIAPIVGYRQLADKTSILQDACVNALKIGDKTGIRGVEKLYDCELRGRVGKKLIEIDARGMELKTISVLPPKDGADIQLALDMMFQTKAYELIKKYHGAVVAMSPKTGEIFSLVSSPSFNPQSFEDGKSEVTNRIIQDIDKPLFNRATEGTYPLGSIFKLVVASAALEEGKITDKTIFEDTGTIKAGASTFGTWAYLKSGKTEGMVNIVKGLKRSNDIFFYKTGEATGPTLIKKWANRFGYGKVTNIGLSEAEGLIPSPFWKEEQLKEKWYLGDTYNMSIGQGYLLVTPIQVTQVTSLFASKGLLCKPQLKKNQKSQCVKSEVSEKTIDVVREGMREACSAGGTGWPFFDFSVKNSKGIKEPMVTGCKTGTAESHEKSGIPHAWFTVFAPFDNPQIAITVLLEEAGEGSDVAAPIAKELLTLHFERSQ